MANTVHGTLTADQVEEVEVVAGRSGIVIVNRTQTGVIWVRIDGQNPTEEGDDSYAVLGVREFPMTRSQSGYPVDVRMLSNAERAYTVEAY